MSNDAKVELFKALADLTRLSILRKLATSGEPVLTCSLIDDCTNAMSLSQPTMSHHINKLVNAGILIEQKHAKQKAYALNNQLLDQLGIDIVKLTK